MRALITRAPLNPNMWEIILTTADGSEHVLLTFRKERRAIKDLNAAFRVVREIGLNSAMVAENA